MAASPIWKVYREGGEYVASCKYVEDAARLVDGYGDTIRFGHKHVVWNEGEEAQDAAESYDFVAIIAHSRLPA